MNTAGIIDMNDKEKKALVKRISKEILGETSHATRETRENLHTIALASLPYLERGVPFVDIVRAVKKKWDKFLEKVDRLKLNHIREILYWRARAMALQYAMSRSKFLMPVDGPAVSYPGVYESLPRHVMDFLKSIDKDDTILVVSDCDKGIYMHENIFSELREFLFSETHHMTVRVGGNSFRFAERLMGYLVDMKDVDIHRFEFFLSSPGRYLDLWKRKFRKMCAAMTVRWMDDYKFDFTSDFMRYADRYDIRGSGVGMNYATKTATLYGTNGPKAGAACVVVVPSAASEKLKEGTLKDGTEVRHIPPELGLRGSMATLWVRNEESGYIREGEFYRFNSAAKGAWAIADVMMTKGYKDVQPATHALYSDTWSNLMENERQLFKDAGLVCHHLIRSYEELDAARLRYEQERT